MDALRKMIEPEFPQKDWGELLLQAVIALVSTTNRLMTVRAEHVGVKYFIGVCPHCHRCRNELEGRNIIYWHVTCRDCGGEFIAKRKIVIHRYKKFPAKSESHSG